jgi:hypothetical protein
MFVASAPHIPDAAAMAPWPRRTGPRPKSGRSPDWSSCPRDDVRRSRGQDVMLMVINGA